MLPLISMAKRAFSPTLFFPAVAVCAAALFSCGDWKNKSEPPESPDYPFNNKDESRFDTIGSQIIRNPYGWLEDLEDQKVLNWAKKQNQTTFEFISRIPSRKKIQKQLEGLAMKREYRRAMKEGKYYFYSVSEQDHEREVIYYFDTETQKEKLLIDPVAFSGNPNARLAGLSLSVDDKMLAFSLQDALTGNEKIFLKNMESDGFLSEIISCSFNTSLAWDNKGGLFYNRELKPEFGRGKITHAVFYHIPGTSTRLDEPVYFDPLNPKDFHQVTLSSDFRYIFIKSIKPKGIVHLRFTDLQKPPPHRFSTLIEDTDVHTHILDQWKGNRFLVRTRIGSPNGRIVIIDPLKPQPQNWEAFIKEKEDIIQRLSTAGGLFFVRSTLHTFGKVTVYDSTGTALNQVELPGLGMVDGFHARPGYDEILYTFQSLNHPITIFRYLIREKKSEIFRKPETEVNPENYIVKKEFCLSADGSGIPIIIFHHKDLAPKKKSPLILFFSGGMNEPYQPNFTIGRLPFVDEGGVFVLACLRGNQELDQRWRDAGKGPLRDQTMADLKLCIDYLLDEKYTSPGKMALVTKHAGLMPAIETAINQPGMIKFIAGFQGIFDMTGFPRYGGCVSCVRDEVGDVENKPEVWNWAEKHSPLNRAYDGYSLPAIYLEHAIIDRVVSPVHSFKFIAALQDKGADKNPKLIRIDNETGAVNKRQELFIQSDRLALAMYLLGMEVK